MADFLSENESVKAELTELVERNGAKAVIDELKDMQSKKNYKVKGRKMQAQVIRKDAFINLCLDNKDGGLSDESIGALQKLVQLSEN